MNISPSLYLQNQNIRVNDPVVLPTRPVRTGVDTVTLGQRPLNTLLYSPNTSINARQGTTSSSVEVIGNQARGDIVLDREVTKVSKAFSDIANYDDGFKLVDTFA